MEEKEKKERKEYRKVVVLTKTGIHPVKKKRREKKEKEKGKNSKRRRKKKRSQDRIKKNNEDPRSEEGKGETEDAREGRRKKGPGFHHDLPPHPHPTLNPHPHPHLPHPPHNQPHRATGEGSEPPPSHTRGKEERNLNACKLVQCALFSIFFVKFSPRWKLKITAAATI